jgi:hypothetical protein
MLKANITSPPSPGASVGLFDNGCAVFVPHGRDMSHNDRTLLDMKMEGPRTDGE